MFTLYLYKINSFFLIKTLFLKKKSAKCFEAINIFSTFANVRQESIGFYPTKIFF